MRGSTRGRTQTPPPQRVGRSLGVQAAALEDKRVAEPKPLKLQDNVEMLQDREVRRIANEAEALAKKARQS